MRHILAPSSSHTRSSEAEERNIQGQRVISIAAVKPVTLRGSWVEEISSLKFRRSTLENLPRDSFFTHSKHDCTSRFSLRAEMQQVSLGFTCNKS